MKYQFPEGFLWGAAASGPQTEGIKNKANLSIWEHWFEKEPDRFYNNLSNYIACDTYNRYKEDVQLMTNINMNSFRTSIQWSRLIKDYETNEVCDDAVKFYRSYFEEMINNGVTPIINLYHFDMPLPLYEQYGGFESKVVCRKFAEYAKICFELFGDIIKYWTTFNEPIVPVEGGYFDNFHFPNKIDPKLGIQVGYNTQLAHSMAVEEFRKVQVNGEIGITVNLTPVYPRSDNPEDVKASEIANAIFNKSFVDPSVNGQFPELLISILKEENLMPIYTQEELDLIGRNEVDFLGINYYVPRRVCAPKHTFNESSPWHYSKYFDGYSMPGSRNNPHRDDNEIYPKALYDIGKTVQNDYGNLKWYVAEIGISITGEEHMRDDNGMVDDQFRTSLFEEHLVQLHKAIEEGSNCFGVHQWTFIDNWSWLNSHKRRYGFYFLDLETRDRHIKKHAYYFKKLSENNGFEK
ncbi:glycoside hydrolase family 1 protein [Mollicutes bacterium LVI A0039]|nr:glycoside hydrolase family 1 protein [Mollicutes bacterium LVI A0039]